jgi:citrate synthase
MADDTLALGLEGVTVGETRLSRVDGEAGELIIGGFPLEELAPKARFEETLYLLYEDRLPDGEALDAFEAKLIERRSVPDSTVELLRAAAEADQNPMDALRMGAAAASNARGADEDPEEDALLLVAQFPTIVAAYWRLLNGEEPVEPRDDLGHAANYLYMLTGEEPDDAAARGLATYLNAVVDHGLNASTFTARTIVSTESDVVSAVTGAVGALKGPLHGGAPGPALAMLLEIQEAGDAEPVLRGKLEAGERLMGFGHRVYRVRDPRAEVLSAAAERFYEDADDRAFYELAGEVEDVAVDLLAEHRPERSLQTNVEFYTAVLLHGVGIPQELFAATFGVSRVGGWTAHCLEQLGDNRLIRPRARYVGDTGRTWTNVEER